MPHCGTGFRKRWGGLGGGEAVRGKRRSLAWRSSGIAGVRARAAPAYFRAWLRVLKGSTPAGYERELLPARGCKKARRKTCRAFLFFRFEPNAAYSATGAPTGQTPAQAPHSMQVSALISYLPSPSAIAPTGHSPAQEPHIMQPPPITYAIGIAPPNVFYKYIVPHVLKKATKTGG